MRRYGGCNRYQGKYRKIRENIGVPDDSWQELDMGYITPCWIWKGRVNKNFYGIFDLGIEKDLAHRYIFEHYKGKISYGLELDHLCRVRTCVNPEHLETVTRSENLKRKANKPDLTLELYQCLSCGVFAKITDPPTDKNYLYYCSKCK